MKKIFTLAAAALITLSAAADIPVKADPTSGSTVTSLEKFTLSSTNAAYPTIWMAGVSATIEKDGSTLSGYTFTRELVPGHSLWDDEESIDISISPAITEEGDYTITIAGNCISLVSDSGAFQDYVGDTLTLTYTVGEEVSAEDPLAPYKLTATPASGSKLAALAEVNISYSMDDYWGIIPNYQKMSIKKDGEVFCGVTGKTNDSDFIVRLETPATEPGVYTIEFAANTFNFANAEHWMGDGYIKEPITLTYYVGESKSGDKGIKIKSDPEVGVVTAPLSQVTLSYSFEDYATIELNEDGTAEVLKNGEPFCGVTITPDDDWDTNSGLLICRFATPITEPGTYTLLFGANSLDIYTETEYWQNDEELAFNYTVEGTVNPSDNYKWTMTPANGEQLNSLESVLLTYSFEELNEVMVTESDKIKVLKDGQDFCGVTVADADDYTNNLGGFRFTLKTPATEAGTYSIVFEKGSLSYQELDSYFPQDLSENLTYTYIVTGTPQPSGYMWTVTPADGKVVEKLESIEISYSTLNYEDIDVVTLADIAVYKNGTLFSNVSKTSDIDSNPHILTFTLKTPATEPGTYTFTIKAGAIKFFDANYKGTPNAEDITFTYTIEGEAEFAYTTTPASGDTFQAPFSDITFNYFNCGEGGLSDDLKGGITVTRNGEAYDASFTVTNNIQDMNSVLSFVEPVTEEGTYTITLPSRMLYYFTDKTFTTVKYVPVTLTFNVTPAPQPVVYDLNPTKTNPANDATIDLAERDFNTIFIYVPNDVSTAADAKLTVTNEAGTYSNEVPLKFNYTGCLWATIPDAKENGVYTISIPQGAFGDAEWQKNPEFGHANPAFTITVNVTCGAGADFDLNYLSYTPAGAETTGLGEITITFPEGTQMDPGATATLADASMDYFKTATFAQAEADQTTFSVKFEPAPTSLSMYRLTIPMGVFGDAEFFSSNGTKGHANPEITIDWNLSGINVIEADGTVSQYFNLQGQPIAFPAKGQVVIKVTEGKATKIVF